MKVLSGGIPCGVAIFIAVQAWFPVRAVETTPSLSSMLGVKQGNPPISQAAMDDNGTLIRDLVQKGIDINATNKHGRTALMWAAEWGCTNALRALLDSGAKVDIQDEQGRTALMNAVESGQLEVVRQLVAHGANIETRTRAGFTPLMYAAMNGRIEVLRYLAGKGANLNAQKETGATALITAVLTGHADVVSLLVSLRADQSIKTKAGLAAIDYARLSKRTELTDALAGKTFQSNAGPTATNNVINFVKNVEAFRLAAAIDIDAGVQRWGDADFKAKWTKEMEPLFSNHAEKNMLRDFFSGAMLFVANPSTSNQLVAAVYSPWCDCIMLVQAQGNTGQSNLTDFCFVAGETWRNEKIDTAMAALKLYNSTEPLMFNLAKEFNATEAVFKREYVSKTCAGLLPPAMRKVIGSTLEELRPPVVRLLYRQNMYKAFLAENAKKLVAAANEFIDRVQEGDSGELQKYVASSQNQKMLDAIEKLPKEVRAKLYPAYFSGNPRDGIVAFQNPEYPSWAVIVRVKVKDDTKSEVTAELMPFMASRELAVIGKEPK